MWHEARRQERKIRGMLVDYRKRAERRRDFYEKIKADPTQFLQVHGRQCKIHLDPQVAAAADSAVMMPWQGNSDTLIDRFDGRAHLDYIPPVKKEEETELSQEERQLNYERYRIIAQNSFLGINEEKFLKQLQIEEQFGYTEFHQKGKKEQKSGGAAIGFNYDEGTAIPQVPEQPDSDHNPLGDSDSDADCSDLDVDLSVNVSKMDAAQAHEMNKHGRQFGMHSNDFYSFLTDDMEEAENRRMAREEEQEKALYAGRKSRRERRYHREKRLANRVLSPPSYAARESPTLASSLRESKSASRSPSPENTGKITFITSFGGEDETPSSSKAAGGGGPSYADKLKQSALKGRRRSGERTVFRHRSRSDSRRRKSRSGSRIRSRRSRSRSASRGKRPRRSRSPLRRRSRSGSSRSRSRSTSVVKRKSRSRSYSRDRKLHSKPAFRGVSNTGRNYKRQRHDSSDSSSSSSSSSRGKSPVKRKSYSASPTKETFNKSRQHQQQLEQEDTKMEVEEPPKVLPRYYGRKRSDKSSSDEEEEHGEENQDNGEQQKTQSVQSDNSMMGHGNSSGIGTKKSSTNMTIIERLKRKRQALLNRQFKADKIAEQLKTEREKQEQQTREDELRMMAIKLRRKQRERRHANDSRSNSSSDSDEGSRRSKSSDSSSKKRPSPPPREKDRERSAERDSRSARHRTDYRGRSRSRERSRERDSSRRGRRDSRDRKDSRDRRISRDRRDSRDRNIGKDKRLSPRRIYRDRGREDKDRGPPKISLVDY